MCDPPDQPPAAGQRARRGRGYDTMHEDVGRLAGAGPGQAGRCWTDRCRPAGTSAELDGHEYLSAAQPPPVTSSTTKGVEVYPSCRSTALLEHPGVAQSSSVWRGGPRQAGAGTARRIEVRAEDAADRCRGTLLEQVQELLTPDQRAAQVEVRGALPFDDPDEVRPDQAEGTDARASRAGRRQLDGVGGQRCARPPSASHAARAVRAATCPGRRHARQRGREGTGLADRARRGRVSVLSHEPGCRASGDHRTRRTGRKEPRLIACLVPPPSGTLPRRPCCAGARSRFLARARRPPPTSHWPNYR